MNFRAVLITAVIPLFSSVVGVATAMLWAPALPDRIAEQWKDSGVSSTTTVTGIVIYFVVSGLAIAGIGALAVARASSRASAATTAAISIALSVFVTVSLVGLMAVQRGTMDATAATGPPTGWIGAAAAAAAASGGAAGWAVMLMLPTTSVQTSRKSPSGPRSSRRRGGVYVRTTVNWYLVGGLILAGVALLVAAFYLSNLVTAVAGVVVLSSIGLTIWRLLVDEDGVYVFSLAKVVSRRIPMEAVRSVKSTTVRPFRDFGGYGLRSSSSRNAVNGQVDVPGGGQVKVPAPCG